MRFDVVVVGAGLVGASFAIALSETGYRIALVEGRPPTSSTAAGWDSRVYALSPASKAFLDTLGVWTRLDIDRITPIHEMQIFGDHGGRLDFSAYRTGVGELAWIVESSPVQLALWECLKSQANLTLFCPSHPAAMSCKSGEIGLVLGDGRKLAAELVVAADGVNSWVRKAAGMQVDSLAYQEKGVVANFQCDRPHGHCAFQWFRSDGVLAYLPLPGNRISVVWSTADAHADRLVGTPDDEFCAKVAEASGHRLGSLRLLTPPASFPLRLMRASQVVAPRVALIGDAAHSIHPLSGHGVNLGFQDARVLAKVLAALPDHRDCGDVNHLRRYARARAEEVLALQMTTHALQRLFGPKTALLGWLRNLGLNLTNRLPVVREALVRYALG